MGAWLSGVVADLVGAPDPKIRIEPRAPLDHQSNRLYDAWVNDRRLIVKEYLKPDEFATGPAREYNALRLLAPFDVAPQPVGMVDAAGPAGRPVVVYQYLDGAMWAGQRPTADDLAALADVWLRVHAVPTDHVWAAHGTQRTIAERYARFRESFGAFQTWTEAAHPAGMAVAVRCMAALEQRQRAAAELNDLERLGPPRCFCQADTRFANVIRRRDGRAALVDWEDSGLSDPARDVVGLLTHPDQEDLLSPDAWQPFLEPYLAVRAALDPHLQRRIELYAAIYPLYWLATLFQEGVRRAARGELAGWTVNGMPANQRLRRYLARALAWPAPTFDAEFAELAGEEFFPARVDPHR